MRKLPFSFLLVVVLLFLFPLKALAVQIQISDPVVVNDEVAIDISITELASNSCPNTQCFLQGMFTSSISTPRYFGFTMNNSSEWYEYNGSPNPSVITSSFFSFTPVGGEWTGQLKVKNNSDDSDYKGPGMYYLRVRRYTGNSSSATSGTSNDLTVQLSYQSPTPVPTEEPATPEPTSEPTDPPTSTPTPTPTPTPKKTATPTKKPTTKPRIVEDDSFEDGILGAREDLEPSPTPEEEETKKGGGKSVLSVVLIVLGIGFVGFAAYPFIKDKLPKIKIKKDEKDKIPKINL